jgi:hypothetical protein
MIGGQNTGSDGCATTYSKVKSDERTTAGGSSRKLDIGSTTSVTETAADEDADGVGRDANDVSDPDEGEYAVDAAEYNKTTAEIVTWLVPPPALPPEGESIPTTWIDAKVHGYTNGIQEATEAVGTTREGGWYSAEARKHQGNKGAPIGIGRSG